MNNAKSVRTPTLPELFDDNKNSLLLPQVQVNNHLMSDKPTTISVNKRLQHQLLPSSDATMIKHAQTEYVQETSSGTLNATALKFTTLQKPT
jgi:hypothetical protein